MKTVNVVNSDTMYTPNQQTAINTIDQNLQIIACAGSGKTQVISERVINILKSKPDVKPANIIAFTFTEKAGAELKARILKLCKEQLPGITGLSEMYIGTIHGWCMKTLQDNVYKYQKFSVLEPVKLKLFVDKYYQKIGMAEQGFKRYLDTGTFIQRMSIARESELLNCEGISRLKEEIDLYEKVLMDSSYFDFTMVLTKVIEHFEKDQSFSDLMQKEIKYLIVDEYQDVNPIQEKIVENFDRLGANICVVGDDDQTIYQWRGGDVEIIQNFGKKYENVKSINLEDNFRSSEAIVDVALKVITNNEKRLPKLMNSKGHQKYERGDILFNTFDDVDSENEYIAKTIKNLLGTEFKDRETSQSRGLAFSDFSVLLRKWKKADALIEVLKAHKIPFVVAGVNQLFKQPEVRASHAIFLYLDEQIDGDTLKLYWTTLSSKISERNVDIAIKDLKSKFPTEKTYYENFNFQQIFWDFLDKAEIREECFEGIKESKIPDSTSEEIIFYNLGMFSQVINDFETIHYKTSNAQAKLRNFLNFLKYSAEGYYPEGWLNNAYKTPNAVQIMTVYQSKGLEFPVVFIPGLNKNYLPTKKSGESTKFWKTLDKNFIKNQERYEVGIEDERRLFYVAITRSQKYLFVTRAPDNRQEQKESDFCKEIRKSEFVFSTLERDYAERARTEIRPKNTHTTIDLNFSILKAYFDCPFSFKMYCVYGFAAPLGARIGYGKSMHNILMEVHKRWLAGENVSDANLPELLENHTNFPYATELVKEELTKKTGENVKEYLKENLSEKDAIQYVEKSIQIDLGEGILVEGRMDLIKKKLNNGAYETTIVDFKSTKDVQKQNVTEEQLRLYALGYQELTGEKADFLQIYNLDENDKRKSELSYHDLDEMRNKIKDAANNIRKNNLNTCCGKKDCICRFKIANT